MTLFARSCFTMLPVTGKHQATDHPMNEHIVRSDSGLMLIAKVLTDSGLIPICRF